MNNNVNEKEKRRKRKEARKALDILGEKQEPKERVIATIPALLCSYIYLIMTIKLNKKPNKDTQDSSPKTAVSEERRRVCGGTKRRERGAVLSLLHAFAERGTTVLYYTRTYDAKDS